MSDNGRDYFPGLLDELRSSDPAAARAQLEQAAQAHSDDARPLALLAASYAQAQEIDRAEATYVAALQRAPDLAMPRFQLGLLQFQSARPAAAQATWAPLDRLGEKEPLRLFKTGLELLGRDRLGEARSWLEAGIAQNGTNPALNRDMQIVLDHMARRNVVGSAAASTRGAKDEAAGAEGHLAVRSYGRAE